MKKIISKSMLKNFSYLGSSQILILLLGLLTNSVWARYASIEEFGKYQLLISFISVAGTLSIPGMITSAQLSAAKEKFGNLRLICTTKLRVSFFGSLCLVITALYYQYYKLDLQMARLLYLAAIIFPFYNLKSIWEGWFVGSKEYRKVSILMLLIGITSFLSILIGILWLGNLYVAVSLLFLSVAVINIISLKYTYSTMKEKEIDHGLIKYGLKLSLTMLIPMVMSFDRFIISEYLSVDDVAIYSIAIIIPMYVKPLNVIIHKLMAADISAANSIKSAWQYTQPKLYKITLLFFLIGTVGFLSLDWIIEFVFTNKYSESMNYSKWLFISVIFTVPATYLGNILRAQQKISFSFYYETFNSVGRVLCFLAFIPFYGLWGAVGGLIFMNISSAVFMLIYFLHEYSKE